MKRFSVMIATLVLLMVFWVVGNNTKVCCQTPPAPPDGAARCINDKRQPDETYPDQAHTSCPCWGYANPNEPEPPDCKPQEGEDPRCTNHCKKDMCDCKSKCQS